MPSPFSFFASTTSSNEDPRDKPQSSMKTLRIELANSELVLMTGKTTTLQGVLYVNLQKSIKVKSLQIEFSGRSSVTWVDDNAYSPATRHTTSPHIEHTWPFISQPHKKSTTTLEAGQHAYPFSLELPDTLPESLTTTHGKVAYRVTATLTKPGITFNSSSTTVFVHVLRKHSINASGPRTYHRGDRVVSAPEDKIQYKITLPQVRVPHSTKVPLQVSITPPDNRITVQALQVGLWERVVYRADGRKRVDVRLVKVQKCEGWSQEDQEGRPSTTTEWNRVLLFDMPQMGPELNQCNPSTDNGLMKVNHYLRFTILGMDGTKRLRVENEMDLKVLAFEDEYAAPSGNGAGDGDPLNELPSYLTSFSTPRVSFDSEREMDNADDDLLRALMTRIHLPTYAESEEDTNSRNASRDASRNASQAPSRCTSPERLPARRSPLNEDHGSFLSLPPSPPSTPSPPQPVYNPHSPLHRG
ncbi:hypothetical protein BGX34_000893 [Mortierella sp. NVP85]|nr:hypothetical protein BGX34_000893 [Mortierella sp. NVP85]